MERLTHQRCNGIAQGYWSPAKKEELVQRLALFENIDPDPTVLMIRLEAHEGRFIPHRIPDINAGYKIIAGEIYAEELPTAPDVRYHIRAIVLGAKPLKDGGTEYVTWDCFDDGCSFGHYWNDFESARLDYHKRLLEKYLGGENDEE